MKTIILGCGGHGTVIRDICNYNKDIELIGFLDDNNELHGKKIGNLYVIGGFSEIEKLTKIEGLEAISIGIGNNKIRSSFYYKSKELGLKLPNIIHPSASISKYTTFGDGIVIMHGVIINTSSHIGNNVHINTGAQLDHDNHIEDHVHIYPRATLAGGVKVGESSYIGMGALIRDDVKIGRNSFVGMGSVVTKNVDDNVMVFGNPARVIKRFQS